MGERIIEAWIQHPTPEMLADPMFASLRAWLGLKTIPKAFPLELTRGLLEAGGVERALLTAWWGPRGPLVSNDLARKFPNAWIDTSAYKPSRYPAVLVDYLRSPRHKVLFGSNAPMITPRACLDQLDALGLKPKARERFLSANSATVFGL